MKKSTLMSGALLNKIKEKPYEKIGLCEVYTVSENWVLTELAETNAVYQVQNVADFEEALQTRSDLLVSAYLINKPVLTDILKRTPRFCRVFYGDF